ncbi:hypothetical protein BGX38DRAFT_1270950 [Terfezia claveryi]|nr:hypothetical protein BGX38DRAFT_1270950 [Terfezia claveryi]
MRRTGATEDVVGTPSKTKAVKSTPSQKRNRSITQFTGFLRDMTESAGNRIEHIMLFEEPFPDPQHMEDMLDKLRSVQSRTRSHLVSEVKKNIAFLYQFDRNTSKQYIQDHIGRLLKRDRFTCAESLRKSCGYRFRAQEAIDLIHYQYFNGKKKLGNIDPTAGKVGNVQLRLSLVMSIAVAAESMASIPNKVQEMIVKVTQSEIVKKGQQSGKKVRWQQDAAYEVDDEKVAEFARKLSVDLREAGVSLLKEEEEEEDDSGEGEKNIRDEITSVEEDEGESMQCAQRSTRGIGGWEEEDD